MIDSVGKTTVVPFWLALVLGVGSLLCYLTLAALARITSAGGDGPHDFNLGVPKGQDCSQLFGISVAAAGTPLSTVVAFFLLNGSTFGVRLFLCPLFFALGILATYWVYRRAGINGYFKEGTSPNRHGYVGLIPFLGTRLSGSSTIGDTLLILCALPLLGLLTLEIAFGIQVIEYISAGAFQIPDTMTWRTFFIFAVFMILLLGYVFVGGFRAVVRSDVLQYKLIQTAVVLSLATFLVLSLQTHARLLWNLLWPKAKPTELVGFYIPVIFVNLVLPLGLVSSWQRFRAFEYVGLNMWSATLSGVKKLISLWVGLILLALCFVIFGIGTGGKSLAMLFNAIQSQGDWYRFFVFPILAVAALSAMYSCSDTCVSALLYLIEYPRSSIKDDEQVIRRLSPKYYWAMASILSVTLFSYWFLRIKYPQDITAGPLFKLATALYANLSVIAPTLVLMALLVPAGSSFQMRYRSRYITASLLVGLVTFWGCMLLGFRNSLWSQCATIPALVTSSFPAWLLYRRERRVLRSEGYDRRSYSISRTGTVG
ncbi:MAG TPA: hypothetical protein VI386_29725 [Candidatus Sulfotelmatobacter sp.]